LPRQAYFLLNTLAFTGHTTGRADLRHPGLRLASSQGLRLCSVVHEPEVMDSHVAGHDLDGEPSRAAPAQLVSPSQELANSRQDTTARYADHWAP
jgi:hypothetical protein